MVQPVAPRSLSSATRRDSSTGSATAEIYSTLVSFKGGSAMPSLLDADGSAVVIHANADDHTSQPIGGAGDRVACAVIR